MGGVWSWLVGLVAYVYDILFPPVTVLIQNGDIQGIMKYFATGAITTIDLRTGKCPATLALSLENPDVMRALWMSGVKLPLLRPNSNAPLVSWLVRKRNNKKILSGLIIPDKILMSETNKSLVELILDEFHASIGAYRERLVVLLKNLIGVGLDICAPWTNPATGKQSTLFLEILQRNQPNLVKLLMKVKINSPFLPFSEGLIYILKSAGWQLSDVISWYKQFSPSQQRHFLLGCTESRWSSVQLMLLDQATFLGAWGKFCKTSFERLSLSLPDAQRTESLNLVPNPLERLSEQYNFNAQLIEVMKQHKFIPNGFITQFLKPRLGTCSVCTEQTGLIALYGCGHEFCEDCIRNWISSHATDNRPRVRCLSKDCTHLIEASQLLSIVSVTHESYFESNILEQTVKNIPDFAWCPKCPNGMLFDPQCSYRLQCHICSTKFCAECTYGPHKKFCPSGKHQFDNWRMNVPTKKCPNCSVWIQKDGGCPNMYCTQCNKGFSWDKVQLEKEHFVYSHFNKRALIV